jgi:transglutaminase-like putative cysteine protease
MEQGDGPMRRRSMAPLFVGALAAIGGAEFHLVFGWSPIAVRVVVAAALPALISAAFAWRRPTSPPLAVTGTASIGAMVLFVAAAVTHSLSMGKIIDGLFNGWSGILTTTLPAPARTDLLVLPIVVTWLAAFVGSELVMRVRRPLIAVLPPTMAVGLALLFGVGGSGSRLVPASVFVLVALALAWYLADTRGVEAGDTGDRGSAGQKRWQLSQRTVSGVAVVAGCAALSVLIGPLLPFATVRQPYNPRQLQNPPPHQLQALDPMSLLAGWALSPQPVLFSVNAPVASRWRLAVLDLYDPQSGWSTDARFQAAGTQLPTAQRPGVATVDLKQRVTIGDLSGLWLPSADRPRQVSAVNLLVDPDTGILLRSDGIRPGLTYNITSAVPATPPDCTNAAVGPLSAADTKNPAQFAALAQQITLGATSPCERAKKIAAYLTSQRFKVNPHSASGSTLQRIQDFLTPPAGSKGQGTSEQFATAFALLARSAGLPTRVVVGFHAGEHVGTAWRIHAGDGFAWDEVRFQGIGEVAFDPTPAPGGQLPPEELKDKQAVKTPKSTPSPASSNAPKPLERPVLPPARHHGNTALLVVMVSAAVTAAAATLIAAVAGLVTLRRRLRRDRRDNAVDAAARIVGAWRECLDGLREHGGPLRLSDTAAQSVDRAHDLLGTAGRESVAPVADMVNQVLFSSLDPSGDQAEEAWRCVEQLDAVTAASRTRGETVRRALDVRLLVRAEVAGELQCPPQPRSGICQPPGGVGVATHPRTDVSTADWVRWPLLSSTSATSRKQ